MLNGVSLAISLPPDDLGGWSSPSSVYPLTALDQALLPTSVFSALQVVLQACNQACLPVTFISRPEMFTHGRTLGWLRGQLGEISDHLNISNGATVRLIPGFNNHVFFYNPGSIASAEAFCRLQRRAPELLSSLSAQVWTRFSIAGARRSAHTLAAFPDATLPHKSVDFLGFCLRPGTEGMGARIIAEAGPLGWTPPARLTYIPLTEVSCADADFMRVLASRIARGFFARRGRVVIRLPELPRDNSSEARLAHLLSALASTSVRLPMSFSKRVVLTTADLDLQPNQLDGTALELVIHHSFEVWRHPAHFYARAKKIVVFDDPPPTPYGHRLQVDLRQLGQFQNVPVVSGRHSLKQAAAPEVQS